MIEKLEKFRAKEVAKVESLISNYDGVDSADNTERTEFLTSYADSYKKLPMGTLLLRFLMR